ncbi:hypothetical protein R1T16_06165 [Flavobacterium sp. DG1-102-2]|uniref:hypothetical protein n=1 Tax=Flavobacterium sp. DG1-102-2 TaxID=3081663 RepID=UPI0029492030|nr:hypothetical protein [Flavobacterium sp. DG1-102-2]MDV6168001.1 hypothetical protein [Flavobacterium sp. DG1-102-2]
MSHNYVTFKKYPDAKQARAQQELLLENGIECIFVNAASQLGSLSGDLSQEFELQLHPENFEKAEELLEKDAESMLNDLPEDYYLMAFTNEELHDVVLKHDEWSEFDYMLARRLLAERGHEIDEAHLRSMRNERINELAQPEKDQKSWIAAGYLFAILGGFFGIITGYVLWSAQKTLPNGKMVYSYSAKDRTQGKNIMILGIIVLVAFIGLWLFTKEQ